MDSTPPRYAQCPLRPSHAQLLIVYNQFDSLDEAVQIIASAPLLNKLILVGSTFAQNTISDTAPTAPNIKSLEVDRGEHLSPFLAWLRSSHTVPCVDSLAIGWSHTADLPPICAYIEDIGASLKDLSLEPNFIDNSPNGTSARVFDEHRTYGL